MARLQWAFHQTRSFGQGVPPGLLGLHVHAHGPPHVYLTIRFSTLIPLFGYVPGPLAVSLSLPVCVWTVNLLPAAYLSVRHLSAAFNCQPGPGRTDGRPPLRPPLPLSSFFPFAKIYDVWPTGVDRCLVAEIVRTLDTGYVSIMLQNIIETM